jgi:choline dehydrogenase-like flavoprotein
VSSNPDVIIVGSGASAVHAAWPLVHAGLRMLMLDVGSRDDRYAPMIPEAPFTTIRRTDRSQHSYFLGDEFEGVPFGRVSVGAQLAPPRAFVNRDADRLTPVESNDFVGMESLARGGLAAGWGAGVARFADADLAGMPITLADLAPN